MRVAQGALAACVALSVTLTACATEPPGPVLGAALAPREAQAPNATGALVWPDRLAIDPGLSDEQLAIGRPAGAADSWRPRGTIVAMTPPIVFTRLSVKPSGKQAERIGADRARLDEVLRARLGERAEGLSLAHEGAGQFIARSAVLDEARKAPSPKAGRANMLFEFVSLREVLAAETVPTAKADRGVELQRHAQVTRTGFAFYDAALGWDDQGAVVGAIEPKGLVLLMPGMLGTPGDMVQETVKRLRTSGYAVLRMLAHPSRFTQTGQVLVPTTGELEPAARTLAVELTGRSAEAAYAVEAALANVYAQRPALKGLPHYALGMSGGAMILPTVMARDPDRWAGAVSIGGGVNYLEILGTSNYTDMIRSLVVTWFEAPAERTDGLAGEDAPLGRVGVPAPPGRERALWEAYLKAAPLDSQNLAPLLRDKRWLLVHARTDRAVPAATGERMWELLGRPERQVVDGGHEWLFLTLGRRIGPIVEWLDRGAGGLGQTPEPVKP